MVKSTDWGLVNARPQLIEIPAADVKEGMDSIESSNSIIEASWSHAWLPNIAANKKIVKQFDTNGVMHLAGTKVGKTAYIVGAGPSLDENIGDLKKAKGEDIFTSGRSLKYLLKKGVRPDYTVVLDAGTKQVGLLDVGDESVGMKLLFDIHCSPMIFEVWKGPILFFRSTAKDDNAPFAKAQYDITQFSHFVPSGGNVITSCYAMTRVMGYSRVVFLGNDLCNRLDAFRPCYSDGTQDTVPESMSGVDQSLWWQDWCLGVDIQGLGVSTLGRLENYKFWLDYQAVIHDKVEHINCTEMGMLGAYPEGNLKCIKQMRLVDYVSKHR